MIRRWKRQNEMFAKRQNATWKHSSRDRDQRKQIWKFRPPSWTFVWRHEDTCFFHTAPRQRRMMVAHLTLVTSSIRFAGGRIEVGLARRRQTVRFALCGSR